MTNIFTSKRSLLILAIITIVILVIYFLLKSPTVIAPRLISSNPTEGTKQVSLDQSIALRFDKEVASESLTVTSTPEENWEIENINKDSILITHRLAFLPFTDYQLVVSQKNKSLATLSFTTIASQGDPRLVQTIEEQMKIDYPLSQKLPYETNAYKVVYASPLTLEIRRKNSVLSDQEIITQVKNWVQDNGADPASHKYTVVAPAP